MTYVIIFITAAVSVLCFRSESLFGKLALDPWRVWHRKEWWRVVTHGFVHADLTHLMVNMIVLWSFGLAIERYAEQLQQAGVIGNATLWFLLLYFGAIVFSSGYDVIRRRNQLNFLSVGASGAVSAVIFCSIFFSPLSNVYFFGVVPIPGILFGVLYILYERYMAHRQSDNVNHYAHLLGALFGFVFPLLTDPSLWYAFLSAFSR